jgi:hypothetical protein
MAKKKTRRRREKLSFPFLTPVVYDPDPRGVTEEGKKAIGRVMLFLGDIPGAGHCAVIDGDKVRWMEHPQSYRKATDQEF